MQVILKKKPKNPIIIAGFPGVGLVATIATEYLTEHLKVELIGTITVEEMPAVVAIHNNKMVQPFGIYYNKQYNIVIIHTVAATQGFEWKLAGFVDELATKLQAKEVISIEGLAGVNATESKTYFFTRNTKHADKLKAYNIEPIKEGIVMGVTGALLMKDDKLPITCLFAETHSQLPDSKAAAKIIEDLDKYLGLRVDYEPLMKQAETFEKKLQNLMKKGQETTELSDKKRMSYVG
ncbi:proteasome assembly chaperone family protein [Candidatus Woesearchaeota archaeon]|nr:proteasome assembly chaperone family protein [Candidatus Woesearchaeota archaeon]